MNRLIEILQEFLRRRDEERQQREAERRRGLVEGTQALHLYEHVAGEESVRPPRI